jgi:hypothetical protein
MFPMPGPVRRSLMLPGTYGMCAAYALMVAEEVTAGQLPGKLPVFLPGYR